MVVRVKQQPQLDDNKDEIIRRYVAEGWSMERLAQHYDTSITTISKRLRKWEVWKPDVRHKPHYTLDLSGFEKQDETADLWLDWLAERSRLGKNNLVMIMLEPEDIENYLLFQQFTSYAKMPEPLETGVNFRVRIYSQQLQELVQERQNKLRR